MEGEETGVSKELFNMEYTDSIVRVRSTPPNDSVESAGSAAKV